MQKQSRYIYVKKLAKHPFKKAKKTCKKAKKTCTKQKKQLTYSPKETEAYIYKKPMLK